MRPEAPWLVAVFTSSTCDTCAGVWERAELLTSDQVATQRVDFQTDKALHERYNIDGVPTLVVADAELPTKDNELRLGCAVEQAALSSLENFAAVSVWIVS